MFWIVPRMHQSKKPTEARAWLRLDFIRNALTGSHARARIPKLSPGGPHRSTSRLLLITFTFLHSCLLRRRLGLQQVIDFEVCGRARGRANSWSAGRSAAPLPEQYWYPLCRWSARATGETSQRRQNLFTLALRVLSCQTGVKYIYICMYEVAFSLCDQKQNWRGAWWSGFK